jgi:hypothetical protein
MSAVTRRALFAAAAASAVSAAPIASAAPPTMLGAAGCGPWLDPAAAFRELSKISAPDPLVALWRRYCDLEDLAPKVAENEAEFEPLECSSSCGTATFMLVRSTRRTPIA